MQAGHDRQRGSGAVKQDTKDREDQEHDIANYGLGQREQLELQRESADERMSGTRPVWYVCD